LYVEFVDGMLTYCKWHLKSVWL